jgi:hypothetical protein
LVTLLAQAVVSPVGIVEVDHEEGSDPDQLEDFQPSEAVGSPEGLSEVDSTRSAETQRGR